ncbi:DUF6215 domain-containing protein [Kitasatospora sp. NBC_00070]|uniref:DUF6215 domain-containing protein n=1 Tax=Kitasatospora sp. NBC_00070 TaxID=2975962 RepID=UPI00325142DE
METDTPSAPATAGPPPPETAPGLSARNAVLQTVAALGLAAAALGGIWGAGLLDPAAAHDEPAVCYPPKPADDPGYPALCAALNRPDLPALLGAPETPVSIAQPGSGPITLADGTVLSDPSARVQLGKVFVQVTDNRRISLRTTMAFPDPSLLPTTVLGHPAATFSDHTLVFALDTRSTSTVGSGGIARHLVVAKGPDADGGSFEFVVWRQDRGTPDDAALLRVATQVLPTLPGWVPGP